MDLVKGKTTMLLEPTDLDGLKGQGGVPFENCAHALLVEAGKFLTVPSTSFSWDDRTNVSDGGRDIIVSKGFAANVWGLPIVPSVWSCKAGADGLKAASLHN